MLIRLGNELRVALVLYRIGQSGPDLLPKACAGFAVRGQPNNGGLPPLDSATMPVLC